jgi:3-oxoacyl-[acyl-carrier protein] reductase
MLLKDKVAIVTGAAQGIGKAISISFARCGAMVVIADIDLTGAGAVASEIQSMGKSAFALSVDVSSSKEVETMVVRTLDKFEKIDILVNNAGITRDSFLIRMSDEDWARVIDVNLKGAFNCCREVAKTMIKKRSGKIVNIASIVGLTGNKGQTNYAASKAGLIGLTKSLARELSARGINVNAIAPGFIETTMTEELSESLKEKMLGKIPLARAGSVDDVAKVALFLASEYADYITGQVINVDGGMIM